MTWLRQGVDRLHTNSCAHTILFYELSLYCISTHLYEMAAELHKNIIHYPDKVITEK